MKKAVVVAAAMALLLTGCGRSSDNSQDNAKPVTDGKAKGDITVWAMGTEGEKLSTLAKDFMADNPGAKVTVTAVPWDAAHQKISGAIAGKQTPDVSMVGTTWMGEFAKTGALDPTPTLIDKSAFFPGAWDSTVVNGTSYGVPWYVETRCLYYRKDLADQAGITQPPKTWDDLKAMAQALQSKGGAKWGLYLQPGQTGSWQTFLPFAWSNGAEVTKDGKYTLNTPEAAEALKYYQSYFTDKLSPTDLPLQGALEQGFINGSIGAFISGPWHAGILTDQGGAAFASKFAVAKMPAKKSATSFIGGSDMAVFKDAKNRDGAWKLVRWLSEAQTQSKWYDTVKDLPAVKSAWQSGALADDQQLQVFGQQMDSALAPPAVPSWEQVASVIDGDVEKAVKGSVPTPDAVADMQKQAKSIGTGL